MKILAFMLCLLALAGCATSVDYEQWRAVEVAKQEAAMAHVAKCQTDLCVYMVMDKAQQSVRSAPQQQIHPGWELAFRSIELVATLGLPAYFNHENSKVWANMATGLADSFGSMDRSYTDNSVNVGRDQIAGTQDNSSWADNSDNSNHSDNSRHNYDYSDNSSWSDNSDHSDRSDSRDQSNHSDNRQYAAPESEVLIE